MSQKPRTAQEVIVIDSDDEVDVTSQLLAGDSERASKEQHAFKMCKTDLEHSARNDSSAEPSTPHPILDTARPEDDNTFVQGGTWVNERPQSQNREAQPDISVNYHCLEELRQKFYRSSPTPELVPAPRPAEPEECPSFHLAEDEFDYSPGDWNEDFKCDMDVPIEYDTMAGDDPTARGEDSPADTENCDTCPMCNMTFIDYDTRVGGVSVLFASEHANIIR